MISEKELQKKIINKLKELGWEYCDISNIDNIELNFRNIVEKRNIDRLKNKGQSHLSDKEFEKFLNNLNKNFSFNDYAKTFLDDDQPLELDNGKIVYLNIFNKKYWCKNVFQIAEEVSFNGKRLDILFLINGIPICDMELKNKEVSLSNAFNQTKEYSKKLIGMLRFIQIFIISNGNETKYFANNKNINPKYTFYYSDKNNKPIKNVFDFTEEFLENCTFSKFIARYVINQYDKKNLMALRGYQVNAIEATIDHLKNNNENGYIWHATGSGKTITSFKVAEIIKNELHDVYEKVIFVVDRKDLNSQTFSEYNSFLPDHDKIIEIKNARDLKRELKNPHSKIIITTIQKLNKTIQNKDVLINQKKYVFIFDECHRSQFGDMNNRIKNTFKNSTFIGFSGTPIFVAKDEKNLTTNDIFGEVLHSYLITNAIEDKNVLPFDWTSYALESYTNDAINSKDFLTSETQLKKFADDIIQHFNKRSLNRRFSSIMVLKDINTLIKFYKLFKKEQEKRKKEDTNYKEINVAATFSLNKDYSNNALEHQKAMENIISDFNKITNSNESIENIGQYQKRLQHILKQEQEFPLINLTLLVDQLLTGFDAKKINTIYIARELEKHNLIQAVSRTNRIYDKEKSLGIIISYVPNLKDKFDEATKLYSNSNNANAFLERNYQSLLNDVKMLFYKIQKYPIEEFIKKPEDNVKEAKMFMKDFNNLQENYKIIRTNSYYEDKQVDEEFNIDWMNTKTQNINEIKENFNKNVKKNTQKINPFDKIEDPIYISDKMEINEVYIRRLWNDIPEEVDKENSKKELINIINQIISYAKDNKFISGFASIFEELKLKIINENVINPKKELNQIFKSKEEEFKNKFKIETDEYMKLFRIYKIKQSFTSKVIRDIIDKWINNFENINQLHFLERVKKSKIYEEEIKNYLEFNNVYQNIIGWSYGNY